MASETLRPAALAVIYDRIETRARQIAETEVDWPCRRGCDDCCRSLAEPPVATALEWERLWRGYRALAPGLRRSVRARVAGLSTTTAQPGRHHVCPLLEPDAGVCLVYADRLGACRAYGFYAARDGGRWCQRIEARARAAAGAITWGNHAGVDADLAALSGPPVSIVDWFAAHPDEDAA